MHRLATIKYVLMVMVLALVGCDQSEKAPADPVDALLTNMISAYGGAENLKKLNSYESVWDMSVKVRPEKGEAVVKVAQPDKLRVDLNYPSKSESRVVNGSTGFKVYNGKARLKSVGPMLNAMKLQAMRLYTPLVLKELKKSKTITLAKAEGYNILTLAEEGLTSAYYVNSETNRIERVVGTLNMGGREMAFRTDYADFKVVDGVLMHHSEDKYAGGVNTALLTLKTLTAGVEHAPETFN